MNSESAFSQLFGLPHQERYTVSSGLSNNSITDIEQDHLGFLWIGTADGLNRYDGDHFVVYHPSPEDSTSISDSFISTLKADQDGTLWIGTQKGGVNYYDFHYDLFKKVGIGGFSNRQTDFFVTHGQTLVIEESTSAWVGTGQGIAKIPLAPEIGQLEFILSDMAVNSIFRDQRNMIWVGTSSGLYRLSPSHQSISMIESLAFGAVMAITEDSMGNLLVGGKNGLFIQKNGEWSEIKTLRGDQIISFSNINSIVADNHDHLWVAGQQGLEVIKYDQGKYQVDKKELAVLRRNNLDRENIQVIFLDREENLWIGTANNGLIRLFLSKEHFPVYRQNVNPIIGGTTENTIRSIWADHENEIWIGSYGAGLFRFDREKFSFENFRTDPTNPSSLSGDQVSAIYRDSSGNFWVGTWGDGLNKMAINSGKVTFYRQEVKVKKESDRSKISEIHRFFEDEYGNLWVIANEGLIKKNRNSNEFKEVTSYFDLPYLDINAILEDSQGNWWIGTWNGLFVFDTPTVQNAKKDQPGTFRDPVRSFYADSRSQSRLSNNRITCLFKDSKERIWVGTYGGGLNLWVEQNDPNVMLKGYFESYTRKNGMPNNVVYGILEDSVGRLWLSTNNGLVLFDPEEETFQVFTREDGLQSNQFYFGGFDATPSGKLIFGGNNGFNIIDPLLFSSNLAPPPDVLITDLLIRGEKVPIGPGEDGATILRQSILTADLIYLPPDENNFRIKFLSPTFNHTLKLKYAFRLVGFNDVWTYTDYQNRDAVYSNLFEGTYTFEVKASLNGKNWTQPKQLAIYIAPPWYRTWWAYFLFTILVLLFLGTIARLSYVYSTLRNKLKLEKLSRQKEAEINEMRMWFFTYISHEFRTPLTLIISPVLEMMDGLGHNKEMKSRLRTIYRNSQRLLRMVNQIMNFRQITSGKPELQVSEMDLVAFTRKIGESFTQHARDRQITYEFYADQATIPLWFDAEKMELIIYNLLSNAFKYSEDGQHVKLNIHSHDEWVELQVKDRGIGIPEGKLEQIFEPFQRVRDNQAIGSGIGLAFAKELIELHSGQIRVESVQGEGSTFYLLIRKGKDHFSPEQIRPVTLNDKTEVLVSTEAIPQEVRPTSNNLDIFDHLEEKDKPRILIVEDNTDLRKYLRKHFEKAFVILEAGNGKQGLEMAKKHNPDLIISDVMMPVMDGLSMIKHLKEESQTQHIPIILLTAQTTTRNRLKGFAQGAFEYITKPVDINLLEVRVGAILQNLQQIKAHFKHEGILPVNANHSAEEEKFLLKAAKLIEENLSNAQFNAEVFASLMGISRSGLYKKLQALTGKSTTQFIRFIRLKYAEKLLKEGQSNISQTAFQVGFSDLKYFRKCFKEEFGVTPTEFMKSEAL
ncbi:MAG: two-component regulator propeller domain-containing protein [Bacteroidia bacterium]